MSPIDYWRKLSQQWHITDGELYKVLHDVRSGITLQDILKQRPNLKKYFRKVLKRSAAECDIDDKASVASYVHGGGDARPSQDEVDEVDGTHSEHEDGGSSPPRKRRATAESPFEVLDEMSHACGCLKAVIKKLEEDNDSLKVNFACRINDLFCRRNR
jgi:hypothetical protein